MNFWDFANAHWFVALLMVWISGYCVANTVNRVFRHWNIRKHGYPPRHCDADGDFPKEEA